MSLGSLPGVYAWMTCLPSGAIDGSSALAMDTSTTFCGASTPASQSFTTMWWISRSSGRPAASMPKCKCMKLSHWGVASFSCTHSCGSAPSGTSLSVSHTVALEITALLASIWAPPRSVTPDARPSCTITSSTCAPSSSRPPCFSSPRTRQLTTASDPPLGNSSMALGRNQSSNMKPISAAKVPEAGRPESRKHSRSIQFWINGWLTLPRITSE
mmetsp:Transcript_38038/g.72924  ORF Transcript_38038/g.72924 Transcript_38038/m.72924 type:complete len:214 (+) Transcript_38038:671-1312(+)